jgi:hypothetical protein
MADEGTSFTIDIPVKGQSEIDAASKSVETLAAQLAASKSAYSAAERSANLAARAVERLAVAAETASGKKLDNLQARLGEASKKSDLMKSALQTQAKSLDEVSKKHETAKKKLEGLNKSQEEGKKRAAELYEHFEILHRGLGKLGGPVEEAAGGALRLGIGLTKLAKGFGLLGVIAGISVLVLAFTAAVVEAIKKVAEFGIELANEHRSMELLAQGVARSVSGGTALNDEIERLTKLLPLTHEELLETSKRLADAGLRGKDLTNALQTAGVHAAKLKFGPNFQREMLSLDQQSKVFKANIAGIFGGLKIEGLLAALQKMVDLFDETEPSGRAIKVVFESLFQPLIDGVTAAQPKIEAFFLQLEIWALKALIWFKPHASIFLKIGEAFLIVSAVLIGAVVVAFGILLAAITAPIAVLVYMVAEFLILKDSIVSGFKAASEAAANFAATFVNVGTEIVNGLVEGIKHAGGAVFDSLKGVVTGAVDGVKKFLGISSPSKLFETEIGMQMAAGTAEGVDKGAPAVANSLENLVQVPAASSTAAPTPAPSASKGGANFQGASFVFNGVKDAEDAEARFGALLTRILEGDATTLGATAHG